MTEDHWLGRTIAGRYRVDALLGKGGMGVVVRARHVHLDEHVAIKLLLARMIDVPGVVGRFMREARAAAKIKSDHVVRVTDVDLIEDGVPYMVMEYLDGMSLAAVRRRHGQLAVPEAARCVVEACDAISEAHSLGIVHRDIKPANLFLARGRDGAAVLKVLDFGISKLDAPGNGGDGGVGDTTEAGQILGSPKYMAPEQMVSSHDVDGRADIWSLGAVLYELLTGRPPFTADSSAQVFALVLNKPPAPPRSLRPDLPAELEAVILRCLEKDRARRPATAADLAAALAPFAEGASLPALPDSDQPASVPPRESAAAGVSPLPHAVTVPQVKAPPRRTTVLSAAMFVLALVIAGAGAGVVRSPAPRSSAAVSSVPVAPAAPPPEPSASAAPAQTQTASPPPSASAPTPRAAPLLKPPPKAPSGDSDPFGGKRR